MTSEEAREHMGEAIEAVRRLVIELSDEDRVHPLALVLALAHAAGELGAGVAEARGEAVDKALDELTEVLREAGADHERMLRAVRMPVAGSA